ncbi:cyclic dehypoxanthinyl futalosine synthase [Sporolituus thermophilus]|uniref:Cyclic dehypoxanthine futalosine synthase n=1 Tax=Sporolituus thermophilus DSM 23256 TaxID=1123285 RepID=A0A1G7N767_9FIRM|nr:cyclic dehypoxanthinyl futalosine synthase [Sporolituus thermophilus]SDF69796.1 de-hypoxanthine futalosine cyclase [Sporolituus thermophilus DSM 23256]
MSAPLTPAEGLELLAHGDILALGRAADSVRRRLHPGNIVTFIIDRNINYTNVCQSECRFCAFYRRAGHPQAYLLDNEAILVKVRETLDAGGTQIMLQGGLHPELGIEYYTNLLTLIKKHYNITIHSFSPAEVLHMARQSGLPVADVLRRLKAAGLDSLPGGGAEILVDAVRRRVSPQKISANDWLMVMREAHRAGLATTATMVIGMGETYQQRIEHFDKVRRLQAETGGFRAFIMWSYQPGNTALGGEKTSAWDYLRTLAVARLYLDNFRHIQGSWVTQGQEIGQLTLAFGANDLGSIMLEENVVKAAGTSYEMSREKMIALIRAAGYRPAQRDTAYNILRVFDS